MKKLIWALLPFSLTAQTESYWQQAVDYTMNITMDVESHRFTGDQQLIYTNNSPDTLTEVYYHLYFNAFQPGSMMDVRSQNLPDPDRRVGDRISKLDEDEIGFHKIISLKQDGQPTRYEVHQTVLQVKLPRPIPPQGKSKFDMTFESQVPVQIRRSGRDNEEGIDYTMTQWYPKMAAYDEDGWHPDPYVAREFYAPFGRFAVNITIDSEQKLGGTGTLKNPELFWQKGEEISEGLYRYNYLEAEEGERTWRFEANNVHDFAWAADEEYIRTATTAMDSLELNFFYLEDNAENWELLSAFTRMFFERMSARFGKYPYPQFSVMQGGDGGMEYPMATMVKGTGGINGMIGLMVHESAHNWYYGVLASNENQYPWMDEGFTSYAEEEILNTMVDEPVVNPHGRAYKLSALTLTSGEAEPLATPADYYEKNRHYGINAYSRGQVFLAQLSYIIGKESFDRGMLRFFENWKFKHPDPKDFIRVMEVESGMELDWYLNFWVNTTKFIDYGFRKIDAEGDETEVVLENLGTMPMPIRLYVKTREGTELEYYIPVVSSFGAPKGATVLEAWPWTHPSYTLTLPVKFKNIESMAIDQHGFMADVNRANNVYPKEEGQ